MIGRFFPALATRDRVNGLLFLALGKFVPLQRNHRNEALSLIADSFSQKN
jgi:hypothetical protein